jgi:hypothetical protein
MTPLKKHLFVTLSLILSTSVIAGVSDIKSNGSARGYDLIQDGVNSSIGDPGFVTNSLGSDEYKPRFKLDQASGQPLAIDITNATGSPSIDLSRTTGSNTAIDEIVSANPEPTLGSWVRYYSTIPSGETVFNISSLGSCTIIDSFARLEKLNTRRQCTGGGRDGGRDCRTETYYTYTYHKCQ